MCPVCQGGLGHLSRQNGRYTRWYELCRACPHCLLREENPRPRKPLPLSARSLAFTSEHLPS